MITCTQSLPTMNSVELTPNNQQWLLEMTRLLEGPVALWGQVRSESGKREWFRCQLVTLAEQTDERSDESIDVSLLLKHLDFEDEIDIRAMDDGRQLVLCPIQEPDSKFEKLVAVGLSHLPTRKILRQIIDLSQRVVRQAELLAHQSATLESFAEQLSADFEEMTWMRQLADQLVVTGNQLSAFEGTETSMEGLRSILQAESLVLIASPKLSRDSQTSLLYHSSDREIDEASCLDLLEIFILEMGGETLVKNRLNQLRLGVLTIDSLVLTPIIRNKEHFGWLVAVNKRELNPLTGKLHLEDSEVGRHEFGTSEASLMEAAASMLATHAHNVELFHQGESLMIGVIRSMINAVDAKDPYTCGHSERVAAYGRRIAQEMKLPSTECERIYLSGLLHDIGKIGVPDEILGKPDKLTDEEYEVIKKHPVRGYEILKHLKQFRKVLPGVLHHHEEVDGTGYPYGLKGDQIPMMARILAVADGFDAMTSDRAYRAGMSVERATRIIRNGSGSQWDSEVVEAFFDCLDDLILIGRTSIERTEDLLHAEEDGSKPFVKNTLAGVLSESAHNIPVYDD